MNNIQEQEVKVALDKLEERSKKARVISLVITGIAILVSAAVLYYLYSQIIDYHRQSRQLDKEVSKKQKTVEKLDKEVAALKEERADALVEAEKVEEIKEVFEEPKSSSQKVRDAQKIIEPEEKETPTPTPVDPKVTPVPVKRTQKARSITSNINIRKEPNLKAEVVGKLNKGQEMRVIGFSKNTSTWGGTTANWTQVKTPDGVEGFVFSPLIEIIE